jgi:nickel/cobalt exporter
MVAQGDYLSRLLHQGEIGWNVMLLGMLAAFAFGAVHALSPGPGKTLVAAYLVGSRGTPSSSA